LIARYTPNDQWALAARAEYYSDKNGVIIATNTPNGFQTVGYSVNMDVQIMDQALWRLEVRTFNSQSAIFLDRNQSATDNNYFIGTSLSIRF
jgi:hypothetical protein